MDALLLLKERALELSKGFSAEDFLIRGLWKTDLLFKPNSNERTFAFTYVLAQTQGQGCAYCEPDVLLNETLMGQDARYVSTGNPGTDIAILDSVYSIFPKTPVKSFELTGTSVEKTPMRTKVVIDEVVHQVALANKKGIRPRILNVGVVGNFIKEFVSLGYDVMATDFDPRLVDREINGVKVTSGDYTLDLVGQADVVVATGMTLATNTLGDIIDAAKKAQSRVVVFAETGANFGQEYCNIGVDAVISEPFPFYIFQGTSRIDLYRRRES